MSCECLEGSGGISDENLATSVTVSGSNEDSWSILEDRKLLLGFGVRSLAETAVSRPSGKRT